MVAPALPPLAPPALRAPAAGPNASEAALRRAAQAFEAQAFGLLLQPIFATADPSRSRFGGGAAEAQWRPLLVDAFAAAAVRAGRGLGLSDLVLRELLARRANAPPNTGETTP
jgi:flagellar protein FlgJ